MSMKKVYAVAQGHDGTTVRNEGEVFYVQSNQNAVWFVDLPDAPGYTEADVAKLMKKLADDRQAIIDAQDRATAVAILSAAVARRAAVQSAVKKAQDMVDAAHVAQKEADEERARAKTALERDAGDQAIARAAGQLYAAETELARANVELERMQKDPRAVVPGAPMDPPVMPAPLTTAPKPK